MLKMFIYLHRKQKWNNSKNERSKKYGQRKVAIAWY